MNSATIILELPKDLQIQILKDALKEGKMNLFLKLSKVLLDTPVDKGGLATEVIHVIYNSYHKPKSKEITK